MYGWQSDINTVLCSEKCSFYLPSYSVTDAILQLQQNRLCGKVLIWIKGGDCVVHIRLKVSFNSSVQNHC